MERSLDESALEAIVLNTIREGCVGETVAAIEAREAAEYAADAGRRALLLEISEEETRHAELASRFVQWALSQGDSALGHAVRQEFAALAAAALPRGGPLTEGDHQLLRHGVVPAALREVIRSKPLPASFCRVRGRCTEPKPRRAQGQLQPRAAKTRFSAR